MAINTLDYRLVKAGAECLSDDSFLGNFPSVKECANACRADFDHECRLFAYGPDGGCYMEYTDTAACTEGFEPSLCSFYELRFIATEVHG